MKMSKFKKITLIIAIFMMTPIYSILNTAAAYAASPSFTKNSIVIKGERETYQLKIKNTVKGSKYKWSSTDQRIAIVTSKGLVTSVNKGSALIRCKITYPSKKSKTILCTVTVKIPAEGIKINNAVVNNGAHTILVGESFRFTYDLLPSNTSDKVYWSIGEGDKDCIKVDETGNVTGLQAGKVVLVATAAASSTSNSIINDAEIIEVVKPSASVKSAEIISSNEIQVVFESPIDASTVIGADNKLLDSITITLNKNTKNVLANDPGTLTASLSSDLKTLTITSANNLVGYYGIKFTNNIKTTGGIAIEEYYKVLTYIDTSAPAIASVTLDESGMINKIKFTEAINIQNLKISYVALVNATSTYTYSTSSISFLSNKTNYILSTDKRTLSINLSGISSIDYGKTFTVTLSGITDLEGNATDSAKLPVYLTTDTTPKAQAQPIAIARTSYYTLTATFNRAILSPGYATVNGILILGVVDADDNTKVNYTMTSSSAYLSGIQTVYLSYWNGYNVMSNDTSAQQPRAFTVNFTVDKTNPILVSNEYDEDTSILTLTYNKNVKLTSASGVFSSAFTSLLGVTNTASITYSQIATTDEKVIKLQLNNMTLLGSYTFTLFAGFVVDEYENYNLSGQITINNTSGTAPELPGPYAITQSTMNMNQIILQFANKLDVASAQNIDNYSISGLTIISAVVTKNTTNDGATVLLTVAYSSIGVTGERPVTISGVMGYNGSYSEIMSYSASVIIADNVKPYLVSTTIDSTSKNVICLNFNEQIQGTISVNVYQLGAAVVYSNTVTVVGNKVYITLGSIPTSGTYLRIDVTSNNITDLSGNASTISTSLGVAVPN